MTNLNATGVYEIRNSVNGKRYIGSAAVSFKERWWSHKGALRRGVHCNRHLQSAWRKYGESQFTFRILLLTTPADAVKYEQIALDFYQAAHSRHGYNLLPTAGSLLGYKATAETRRRIALAQMGRRMSPELRAAMSVRMKARSSSEDSKEAFKRRMERYWQLPGTRQAMSNRVSTILMSPERQAKSAARMLAFFSVPENREKHRERTTARMQKPESRKRSGEVARKYFEDPANRAAQAERARKQCSSPESRAWRCQILAAGRLKAKLSRASAQLAIVEG